MPTDPALYDPDCPCPPDAVRWNPYNEVTQCHRCGRVMKDVPPTDPAPPLTDAELAAIEALHVPVGDDGLPLYCVACSHEDCGGQYWHEVRWPCDATRLLTELRHQQARVAAAEARATRLAAALQRIKARGSLGSALVARQALAADAETPEAGACGQ